MQGKLLCRETTSVNEDRFHPIEQEKQEVAQAV